MKTEKFTYSWGFFTKLIGGSLRSFPKVWGRLALLVLIFLVLSVLAGGVLALIAIPLLGGTSGIENLYANINVTGNMSFGQILTLVILGILWLLVITIFAIQFYIAQILAIKESENEKKKSGVFDLFFKKSWKYFMPICWGGLRSSWYILWPILVGAVLILAVSVGLPHDIIIGLILTVVLCVILVAIILYRTINILFWAPLLVDEKLSGKKSIEKSIGFAKGNWWGTLLILIGFILLIALPQLVYQWPIIWTDIVMDPVMGYEGWTAFDSVFFEMKGIPFSLYHALTILDISLQMFIFAPFYTFFMYRWMKQLQGGKQS